MFVLESENSGEVVVTQVQGRMGASSAPSWVHDLTNVGKFMASLSEVEFGQSAPRLFLSVPTGQYLPWLLASGALSAPPRTGRVPQFGDRVITDLQQSLVDTFVERTGDGGWLVTSGISRKVGAAGSRPKGIVLPSDTPRGRSPFKPGKALVEQLKKAQVDFPRAWYAQQAFSPIIVIGDGREYLNAQRQEMLRKAPGWFSLESRTLLSVDHSGVSNPDHFLHFPFMILSPEIVESAPWISEFAPRLVIYTRWNYYMRALKYGLFSRAPAVIIGNRRVESNYLGLEFMESAGCDSNAFQGLPMSRLQSPIYSKSFTIQATGLIDLEEEDL